MQELCMGEKAQINILVGEEQKEEWKAYVEESRSETSLTGLIRTSVQNHIASEDDSPASPSPGLTRDIDTLRGELSRVRKDVSWIRNQLQDSEDISGLAQDVFASLETLAEPKQEVTVPSGIDANPKEYQRFMGAQPKILPDDPETWEAEGYKSFRVKEIAEDVGATKAEVEDALEYLQDQFLPVVEVEINGETHYFKEAE